MPSFCRHNRLIQNCPICAEPEADLASRRAPRRAAAGRSATATPRSARTAARARAGMTVRKLERAADDGYRCGLVPGVKSTADAERLAREIALASGRLAELASDPPGLYAEVGSDADLEEATWLAFLIAYLSPLDSDDPFAGIRAARVPWATGEVPELDGIPTGPRTAHDPARGAGTIAAYRAWAGRAGSQAAAFSGEDAWTPGRRLSRVFERLALPGLHRAARYDLLVTLGRLGRYDMRGESLQLGPADDDTTTAAKRVFGIGDTILLERRAADLAAEAGVALEALDLAIANWGRDADRMALGATAGAIDDDALAGACEALGI